MKYAILPLILLLAACQPEKCPTEGTNVSANSSETVSEPKVAPKPSKEPYILTQDGKVLKNPNR